MIDFCSKKQKEALILLVDFQKAFDSVSHKFIDSTLKLYGFGDSIRKWVRLFFNKREATILLGGHLSKKILLEQGDVISPYIFLLSVEILALKIKYTKNLTGITYAEREAGAEVFANDFSAMVKRCDKNLTGITYAEREARVRVFADDLSVMVQRSEKNLRYFTSILVQFHSVSGLKCNLDKTFVVPVGNFRKADMCSNLNLKWVDEFKVLGIVIDNKLKNLKKKIG